MAHNSLLFTNSKNNLRTGFGLVELLVSISIVVLVMGVIMARHKSYEGAVLLRSQAYKVALDARDVQLTAVSAEGIGGVYRNVFGLYFNTAAGSNNFYYTFRDLNNNFFDSSEQIGKRNNMDQRFEIDEIRLIDGASSSTVPQLSVLFERPNFDALFYTAPSVPAAASVFAVEIDVRLLGTTGLGVGEVRTVEITRTGQITVQ